MIRGIYTAASGMLAESLRNDAISNNLANVNTAGYKKDIAITKNFSSMLIRRINDGSETPVVGNLGRGATVDEIAPIHSTGIMRFTGNDLDLAIEGKGFFVVQTPIGERYTRNGTFFRNTDGELVTSDGHRVMGENGPISLVGTSASSKVTIAEDGRIVIDNVDVAKLQLVEFPEEKRLLKEGASLFIASGMTGQPATGLVRQGSLEQSNVNVVSEMVNLIAGFRAYEINAKSVQAHDQLTDKAVNEVGRV